MPRVVIRARVVARPGAIDGAGIRSVDAEIANPDGEGVREVVAEPFAHGSVLVAVARVFRGDVQVVLLLRDADERALLQEDALPDERQRRLLHLHVHVQALGGLRADVHAQLQALRGVEVHLDVLEEQAVDGGDFHGREHPVQKTPEGVLRSKELLEASIETRVKVPGRVDLLTNLLLAGDQCRQGYPKRNGKTVGFRLFFSYGVVFGLFHL